MTDDALCGSEETDIKSELSEAEALDLEELKPHHRAGMCEGNSLLNIERNVKNTSLSCHLFFLTIFLRSTI